MISQYSNRVEIFGWILCAGSMLIILMAKEVQPAMLPYAWGGAFIGALLIGWGAGMKHKKKR